MKLNFKDFKDKLDLIDYIREKTPKNEKAEFGYECCGWCEIPISEGIKEGDHYCHLCPECYKISKEWDTWEEKKDKKKVKKHKT